jgi:hypothetical protein
MKNKLLLFLLMSLILCSCQREVYQPTETSGEPDSVVSTPFTVPTEAPIGVAKDLDSATPQPDWETLYTDANPVSDSQELIAILQDLYDRFMAQLDQPGWYRFYFGWVEPGKQVSWVHISAPESVQFDGLLGLYDYPEFYAPGFIWPTAVVGPDGQVGFTQKTEVMDDYYFTGRDASFSILDELELDLNNIGYFAGDYEGAGSFGHLELLRTIHLIQNPVDDHGAAHREFSFEGWVGTYEDQPAFVLKTTTLYSGVLPMMESGERPVRQEIYTCYDLQNGGAIATKSDYWYQSGNSEVGDWWMLNYDQVEWFEALPEREQQIYDEALRRLDEFNQGGTP